MDTFWLPGTSSFGMSSFMLWASLLLVLLNWRMPVVRNLTLLHLLAALVGIQLLYYVSQLSGAHARYYWFMAEVSVYWGQVLVLLLLISLDIKYLCRTSVWLISLFSLMGFMQIAKFADRFVFESGSASLFSTAYSIVMPAMELLVLISLAYPIIEKTFFSTSKSSDSGY